jgi:hypothetical protein
LPQTFAGGELGHEPAGTGNAVVDVVEPEAAVDVAVEVAVEFAIEFAVEAEVVVAVEVAVVVVVVAAVVVVVVGKGMVVVVTVKSARRLKVVPFDHVSTALMLCDPGASFVESYGSAVPSAAVPAKSKGGAVTVRTGDLVRHDASR